MCYLQKTIFNFIYLAANNLCSAEYHGDADFGSLNELELVMNTLRCKTEFLWLDDEDFGTSNLPLP